MIECAFFGTLGRDGELKVSNSGKQYLRLNVRVGDGDGAQWVSVLAFDPDAIAAADKMLKGARIYVEGRLEVSEWTGQDGAKRHGLSVMSFFCRLSQIGRNKPKRQFCDRSQNSSARFTPPANAAHAPHLAGRRDLDDDIPEFR
jgi:single-strand DNA-binding protein